MKSRTVAVDVPGAILLTDVSGPPDGRCVVLSHPLMMGKEALAPLAELLAARGYRVVMWDHRGQGANRSTRGRPEVNLPLLTADAVEIIRSMGLHKPHVVGQGLGGMMALRLAAWCPDLIGSVTAIAASIDAEHRRASLHSLADHIEENGVLGDIDMGHGHERVVELLSRVSFGSWTRANNPALVAAWERRFADLVRVEPSIRAYADRDPVNEDLLGCRVPVLAVAGAEDRLYPPAVSGAAVADAAGGRSITIDRAGHSVALEQPDALVDHLMSHFATADQLDDA